MDVIQRRVILRSQKTEVARPHSNTSKYVRQGSDEAGANEVKYIKQACFRQPEDWKIEKIERNTKTKYCDVKKLEQANNKQFIINCPTITKNQKQQMSKSVT
jgi:hypothetical protein